jgi:hypothetical protein
MLNACPADAYCFRFSVLDDKLRPTLYPCKFENIQFISAREYFPIDITIIVIDSFEACYCFERMFERYTCTHPSFSIDPSEYRGRIVDRRIFQHIIIFEIVQLSSSRYGSI